MPSERTDSSSEHVKLDYKVRGMLSAMTNRIFRLHNIGGSSSHHHGDSEDDDPGFGVITLAGNNTGAILRGGQDEEMHRRPQVDDDDAPGTHVNSNFQAINNSIMMAGSYNANDPGIHADISDRTEHKQKHGNKKEKEKKKATASE